MKHHGVAMLSCSIIKGLLAMTIPITVMNLSQTLFGIIDMTVPDTSTTQLVPSVPVVC